MTKVEGGCEQCIQLPPLLLPHAVMRRCWPALTSLPGIPERAVALSKHENPERTPVGLMSILEWILDSSRPNVSSTPDNVKQQDRISFNDSTHPHPFPYRSQSLTYNGVRSRWSATNHIVCRCSAPPTHLSNRGGEAMRAAATPQPNITTSQRMSR